MVRNAYRLWIQTVTILLFAGAAVSGLRAAEKTPRLELRVRLLQGPDGTGQRFWTVLLKNSGGEILRQASGSAGGTVRFRKLDPAIYIVCVTGDNERSRCESVDLYPPTPEAAYSVTRDFELPRSMLHSGEGHRISRARLAIPKRARQEMAQYDACRLRGDNAGAVQHLERALLVYPGYPEALNNLGTHYHRAGKFERAARLFRKATEVDPDFATAWLNLGGSLLADGNYRQALEAQFRALALRSDDVVANAQAGMSHYYLQEYGEARKLFERVVQLDPESATYPHMYLVHIAVAEKRLDDAMRYMREFIRYHPYSPRTPYLRKTLENLVSNTSTVSSGEATSQP